MEPLHLHDYLSMLVTVVVAPTIAYIVRIVLVMRVELERTKGDVKAMADTREIITRANDADHANIKRSVEKIMERQDQARDAVTKHIDQKYERGQRDFLVAMEAVNRRIDRKENK